MREVPLKLIDEAGLPVTGLTDANIKFRKLPYGSGDVIAGIGVAEYGVQGNYNCWGFTTWQLTRLYINDVQQMWWGQNYTGDPSDKLVDESGDTMTGELITSSNINMSNTGTVYNIKDPETGADVMDRDYADARYVNTDGDTMTNDLNMNNAGFLINPKNPTGPTHVGDMEFNDARYLQIANMPGGWLVTSNMLIVDAQVSVETTKYYQTIQAAINYANTQSPSAVNRWLIFIMPCKSRAAGYNESITLQPYIDLIGIGAVILAGNVSGGNADTRLENLIVFYDGNLSPTSFSAFNCVFTAMQTNSGSASRILTLSGLSVKDCGFYSVGGNTTPTVISNGNNKFFGSNDVNCPFDKQASDKGTIHSFDDVTFAYTY